MPRIIAITNQKGGIGKTTTAVSVALGLQSKNYKTLLIDTDSQRNSTDTYRAITEDQETLYDLLFEGTDVFSCIQHTEIGDIIASDKLMKDSEKKFPSDASRAYLLSEACEKLNDSDYDFIIIDTPPKIEGILVNVLTYAKELIIPLTCNRYGLQGLEDLVDSITSTKKYTSNSNLKILGMVMVKYNERYKMNKATIGSIENLAKNLNTKVFNTKIRKSVALEESQNERKGVFEYDPNSTTAKDYLDLCDEIINS